MPPATKKLLLIGASRGLGFALAEEYLKRGWHVVATERDRNHITNCTICCGASERPTRNRDRRHRLIPEQVAALASASGV